METIIISSMVIIFFIIIMIEKIISQWSRRLVGKKGEWLTYFYIKGIVRRRGGILYKNIRFPLYKTSTEIDILIVSSHGILCIENKHVSGRITGQYRDKYWQQNKTYEKKRLYNPLLQNEGHIKCLNYHLMKNGLKTVPISSYVVFSNEKADVKIKHDNVGTIQQAKRYIKKVYFRNSYQVNVKRIIQIIEKVKY